MSRDSEGYSRGKKAQDHKGTTSRTVFQSSHNDVGIGGVRIFGEFEMGINGDIGLDSSLCLPQIIMKQKSQLYNMFDIYLLRN